MNTQPIYKSPEGERKLLNLYDEVLSKWPVTFEQKTVNTRFGETFVIACGEKTSPPLVLLHGSGSNSLTWTGDVLEYSRHYRVYAVDILGEPGKSAHTRPSWDTSDYAEWLDDVFHALDIDHAILAGLSLGGWLALKYTLFRPEKVTHLVLISPGGIFPGRFLISLRLVFLSLLGKWGKDRIKRLLFCDQSIGRDAEYAFDLIATYFNHRLGEPPLFSDEQLKSINIPMLFLAGAKDIFFNTPKAAERVKNLISLSTITVLPEHGHGLINTAGIILSFLRKRAV